MREDSKKYVKIGAGLLAAFVLWTILIQFIDVKAIGPNGSYTGFAAFNAWFHQLTGEHPAIYKLTDWLSVIPFIVCVCFGLLGLYQLISRKCLMRVDPDIILLGIYYILVICGYLLFETFPVNFRPVLIDGVLEASYPSSTTLLVLSVMPTLKFQIDRRAESETVRTITTVFVIAFTAFMVIGRVISGVHWATDIIGGILLSSGLFTLYCAAVMIADSMAGTSGH